MKDSMTPLLIARAGAKVIDVELPPIFSRLKECAVWVGGFELARSLTYELAHHTNKLSKVLREGRVVEGLQCTYERYVEHRNILSECRRHLGETFQNYDVPLAPSAPGEAPKGIETTGDPVFNTVWNDTHVPAPTIPAFTGPNVLPVGVQLVGRWFRDRELLGAATWVAAHIS